MRENGVKTVSLTESQRQLVLSALADKVVESNRYLSGPAVPDKPGPEHSCCDFHLSRYERDLAIQHSLTDQKLDREVTIALFLNEGEVF